MVPGEGAIVILGYDLPVCIATGVRDRYPSKGKLSTSGSGHLVLGFRIFLKIETFYGVLINGR